MNETRMLELPRASQWSKVFWRRKSTRYTASLLNIFITNFISVHDNFDRHLNFSNNRFEFLGETSWQGLKEQITTVFSLERFYTSNFSSMSSINQHCHHGYNYLLRRAGRLNSLIWEHEQTSVRAAVRWKMKRKYLFLMFKFFISGWWYIGVCEKVALCGCLSKPLLFTLKNVPNWNKQLSIILAQEWSGDV